MEMMNEAIHGGLKKAMVYHATPAKENIVSILSNGYDPYYADPGGLYGRGLYTIYDRSKLNTPQEQYFYGEYLIKFRVPITNKFLIFDEQIARDIYDENWELHKQLGQRTLANVDLRKYTKKLQRVNDEDLVGKIAKELVNEVGKDKINNLLDGMIFADPTDGRVLLLYNTKLAQMVSWQNMSRDIDNIEELEKGKKYKIRGGTGIYQNTKFTYKGEQYGDFIFSVEDMPSMSFLESTSKQLQNAEQGDIYQVAAPEDHKKFFKLAYTGPKGSSIDKFKEFPYYGLTILFINIENGDKVFVTYTDGRKPSQEDLDNTHRPGIIKDPHIDTFRRSGENALQMQNIDPQIKSKIQTARYGGNENIYEEIQYIKDNFEIPKRDIPKKLEKAQESFKWQKEIGPYQLPEKINIKKSGVSSIDESLFQEGAQDYRKLKYFDQWLQDWKEHYNADKYLKSDSYISLEEEAEFNNSLKDIHKEAEDLFGDQLGEGASRAAYKLSDDRVIKIALKLFGTKANKYEASNFMQTSYPNLFPKVEMRDEDFIWIVMEKVKVIKEDIEILEFFPNIKNFFQKYIDKNAYKFIRFIFSNEEYGSSYSIKGKGLTDYWLKYNLIGSKGYSDEYREQILKEFYNDLKNRDYIADDVNEKEFLKTSKYMFENISSKYRQIIAAANEFSIFTGDLRSKNLGINSDGELVILDASIF